MTRPLQLRSVHRIGPHHKPYCQLNRFILLFMVCAISGCAVATSYGPAMFPNVIAEQPTSVAVRLKGEPVPRRIGQFRITTDSVFGLYAGSAAPGQPLLPLAQPLDSVAEISVYRLDPARTLLLPLLPLGMLFTAATILSK